ncbi:uncharacterized protein BT62DRAFT_1070721 [Guyanagaster necrorhizus]|uniref:Secreted protein n=1 Tax=Guyanagaster necrorhizus TaxID=856835 RepID=A0A9P7W5L5_9AGAR|nr:uncharacterized protein BT62DRAFT_1070721 [Guyanagaster necrorhizus MCA 3950]KAG7453032.1 hypothetical protein BT62DRAFT_1070721 [Guyanagaster necrorhizus MCA 3950]
MRPLCYCAFLAYLFDLTASASEISTFCFHAQHAIRRNRNKCRTFLSLTPGRSVLGTRSLFLSMFTQQPLAAHNFLVVTIRLIKCSNTKKKGLSRHPKLAFLSFIVCGGSLCATLGRMCDLTGTTWSRASEAYLQWPILGLSSKAVHLWKSPIRTAEDIYTREI